ncbi:MAG: molybdenum cofactor biosynthesis protein MoaE [Methyloligellaceae bacterium]
MIRVQEQDFDIGHEVERIRAGDHGIGAIVTFTGTVRADSGPDALASMHLEHYPGMTENELQRIETQAQDRWPLQASLIVHRYGTLFPGDNIVLVVTASKHRLDAFESAEFLMDYLKTNAPFWKKEKRVSGENWVEERSSDQDSEKRWIKPRAAE